MEISIRLTSIRPNLMRTLLDKDIVLVSHLHSFSKARLAQITSLTLSECEEILNSIKPKRPHSICQASDLLISKFDFIRTTIEDLDYALGGGIRCGRLTEISGEAGSGKSNLCSLLSVTTTLPLYEGGMGGEVLVLHTEGDGKLKLALKRFKSLTENIDQRYKLDSKLHVKNCANVFEFMEMVNRLPDLVCQMNNVKLIVLDSITCAFILDDKLPDLKFYQQRSARLTKLVKIMNKLAWDKNIAIVITNHVTYSPEALSNRPALGRLWSHMCQSKIFLRKKTDGHHVKRFIDVTKGALNTSEAITYNI